MTYEVKSPLLGFDDIKKMKLTKIDDIFMKLEDCDKSGVSFTLIDPYALRPYSFDIPIDFQKALEIKNDSKLLVYSIMIIQDPIEKSAINFLAPVIFNQDNKTMGQIILDNVKYPDFHIVETLSNYLN
jgi:flagellar assembly factor FliW